MSIVKVIIILILSLGRTSFVMSIITATSVVTPTYSIDTVLKTQSMGLRIN